MILADVHVHSTYSHDAEAKPEEQILAAIEKGLSTICFTDHYDKDDCSWGPESVFVPEAYFKGLSALKEKYADKINVLMGAEIGMQEYLGDYYRDFISRYPFDFLIASRHLVSGYDPSRGEIFEKFSDAEVYRTAFEEFLINVKKFNDFDVLGHLDYIVRYGKTTEKEYSYSAFADAIDPLLIFLIENGKGVEINTAGLKYGLSFAHPHPDVLKRYKELGGEIITIGSDAHQSIHIAYRFEEVREMLNSLGFRYYAVFEGRKPKFLEL
ncbi:MAG: histidinol-phosphatase HisJ family protein [Lachnospiraceae bacterium]|jgi:histidinol-phosphatase (PHP family)|nr:histidinol-phosphatase HisJ family protein [Lachnospiraceae bacterium]